MVSIAFDDILGGDTPAFDDRSEKAIQNDTLVELYRVFMPLGCFWWRENTGTAWQGKKVKHDKDVLVLADARPIKFGLEGIADIMGQVGGLAIAIEMKDSVGRQRKQQKLFEAAWTKAGGVYILARTAEDAIGGVRRAIARQAETVSIKS